MTSSAIAVYFMTQETGNFSYVFMLLNTSSSQFSVYATLIDQQFNVPILPGGLQNSAPVSAPPGWQLIPSTPPYGFLSGQTDYAGSPVVSGYIMPRDVGSFAFKSSTPPPKTLVFGVCLYNGSDEWGFAYNGVAEHVLCVPIPVFLPVWARALRTFELPARRVPDHEIRMLGTTSRTIGGQDGVPTVNITYDGHGNIVAMSPGPPKLELGRPA
jgi:hypothetical protein